jgi:hypothetical protein
MSVFPNSRKLSAIEPSKGQLENIETRLNQIFTEEELENMDDKTLMRQVERVWPIAQYIDKP